MSANRFQASRSPARAFPMLARAAVLRAACCAACSCVAGRLVTHARTLIVVSAVSSRDKPVRANLTVSLSTVQGVETRVVRAGQGRCRRQESQARGFARGRIASQGGRGTNRREEAGGELLIGQEGKGGKGGGAGQPRVGEGAPHACADPGGQLGLVGGPLIGVLGHHCVSGRTSRDTSRGALSCDAFEFRHFRGRDRGFFLEFLDSASLTPRQLGGPVCIVQLIRRHLFSLLYVEESSSASSSVCDFLRQSMDHLTLICTTTKTSYVQFFCYVQFFLAPLRSFRYFSFFNVP